MIGKDDRELIVLLFKDGKHPVGSEATYFSGLVNMTWLLKRINSDRFVNWTHSFDKALIVTRREWRNHDEEHFERDTGKIPITCLQYRKSK